MRADDDDTVSVDLVEVDSPDARRAAGAVVEGAPATEPGHDAPPPRRRRRRVLVGLSAAVVLGLVGTGVALEALDERRADARWEALAARGLPLVDLGSPLGEAWRLDFGGYPMTVDGDVLVVQAWDPLGSRSPWRGIDLATGEVLWERVDVGNGWCTQWNAAWSSEETTGMGTALSLGMPGTAVPPPTVMVCADTGFGGDLPAPGATATVRVVDIATGGDAGELRVEGSLLSFAPVDADVVLTSVTTDGTVHLARLALADGAVRWQADTGLVAVDPDGMLVGPWPQVLDGLVYLVSPEGALLDARSLETGESVPGTTAPPTISAGHVVLPDGSRVEMLYPGMSGGASDALDAPTVTVTGPDGEERFRVAGELWTPLFSDGSMADRVVVSRWGRGASSLVALDLETGEELWASRAPWSSPVLQADGVVVSGSGYLNGIDLRTGEKLWELPAASDVAVTPVTDGSRILVPIADDGDVLLAALDVRTGAEAWRGPTATGLQYLVPMDGGVLAVTDSALLMYR